MKKALVMVSTCLQNNPPLNGYPPPLCSKAYESSTDGNSEDPHSEFFPNLRSSLHNASDSAASNRLSPSPYEERNCFQDSKDTERKVVFKIIFTSAVAGGIIGKQGTIIRALQNETGASISIGAPLKVSGERVVTISAREVRFLFSCSLLYAYPSFIVDVIIFGFCLFVEPRVTVLSCTKCSGSCLCKICGD